MDNLTKAEKKQIRKQERHEWENKLEQEQKMKGMKRIGMWVGGIVILGLAVWGLIGLVNAPAPSAVPSATLPKITDKDISTGPKNAKVTLVEYADFQCPACYAYHPLTKQLLKDFNGKIFFIYRFFPLQQLHKNAEVSAEAAYAAYLQGKFWPMHDMLFEHQPDWAESNDATAFFVNYAKQLQLNLDTFKKDMDADSTKTFIGNEEDAGTAAGVDATPTFFLNGKQIQNPASYAAFKKLVQDQLK